MPRKFSPNLVNPFLEPEKELHRRLRIRKFGTTEEEQEFHESEKEEEEYETETPQTPEMANPDDTPMWSARETAPPAPQHAIRVPEITDAGFEIKGQFVSMARELNFDGRIKHDPNRHIQSFLAICDLFKVKGASVDVVRLRVFPFTLIGEAQEWLESLESGSITTWDDMQKLFINHFFPPAKEERMKADILNFSQKAGESFNDTWTRFKKMLRECPNHGLNKSDQVQTFYRGMDDDIREKIDAACGGIFQYKSPREAYKLLEDISIHKQGWNVERKSSRKTIAAIDDDCNHDTVASLANSQKSLERKVDKLIQSIHAMQVGCETCGGPHLNKDCKDRPMNQSENVHFLN